MSDGIYAALSGAAAQAQALDVVANNLANVCTTGFKGDQITFRESLSRAQNLAAGSPRQVEVAEIRPDFHPGPSRDTGNAMDLAIDGPGFFAVQTAAGERFTRAGDFRVAADGLLTTQSGDTVQGEGGAIRLDTRFESRVDELGTVWNNEQPAGRIRVVEFSQPDRLVREAGSLWSAPSEDAAMPVSPRLRVGALEQSNVNAVQAMTQLVWISRAYESFHRAIEMFKETDQRTVNDLGR
jgi:flagellar basal-body rod protein FlgF